MMRRILKEKLAEMANRCPIQCKYLVHVHMKADRGGITFICNLLLGL